MASKSEKKRWLILNKAKEIFIKNGYNGVTMKDIISECGISRGGIYIYFSSVDDIFMEVINAHNESKLNRIKVYINENSDFEQLLDTFFTLQEDRLLNIENSLSLAFFEFFISHRNTTGSDFLLTAFDNTKSMITEILYHGARTGCIGYENIDLIADHTTYIFEGLRINSLTTGLTRNILNEQFELCKRIILNADRLYLHNEKRNAL